MYQPKYTVNNTILINIGKIEAAKEVIESAPLLPMWERRFRENAMVRSVHHGTHIEGNQLDFDQAREVLLSQNIHAVRNRDIQEIINYRTVLDYISSEWSDKKHEINEDTILHIHKLVVRKILPPELSGKYRVKRVVIKDSASGNVTFTPPDPEQVPYAIQEFITWINSVSRSDVHPVLKSGISHHELVRIHPFLDGNGRLARALTTLILYLEDYDIRQFFSLEEQYDKDSLSYYESLQEANKGDLTPWLEYFTHTLAIELGSIKNKIKKLSVDSHIKEKLGGKQVFLNERQVKIVEYLQEVGFLQNQAFATLFPDYSEDTVLRDLKDLMQKNIVKKIGRTKGARYVLVKS